MQWTIAWLGKGELIILLLGSLRNHKSKLDIGGELDHSILLKEPQFPNNKEVVMDEFGVLPNLNNCLSMEVVVDDTTRVVAVAHNLAAEWPHII